MQATATTTTNQRQQNEQTRARALVRFNGLTFHSLAAASFLETAVPLHVNRLSPGVWRPSRRRLWLEQVWWPQRAELGRQLREYVEATWPEFDWNAAYHEFYESYRPRSGLEGGHGGLALEALGLCVTAAQAALFYRALANSADEPALRALARKAACDHAGFFDYFPRAVRTLQAGRARGFYRYLAHGHCGFAFRARSRRGRRVSGAGHGTGTAPPSCRAWTIPSTGSAWRS